MLTCGADITFAFCSIETLMACHPCIYEYMRREAVYV